MASPAQTLIVLTEEQLEAVVRKAVKAELAAVPRADLPEVLTRDQAAELLQVHPAVVVKYVKLEGLPSHKLGPEWRFRRSELLAWLDGRKAGR